MQIDLSPEIYYKTSRSGGAGGQNVNKVETAVTAYLDIPQSAILTAEQKQLLLEKLAHRTDKLGVLLLRSTAYRTQLENKQDATRKLNELVAKAFHKKKARIATAPSKVVKEKRLAGKKQQSQKKAGRSAKSWLRDE